MINSEIEVLEALPLDPVHGLRITTWIGLREAKMAVNDERVRMELAEKVGQMVADHLESFLMSPEGEEQINSAK